MIIVYTISYIILISVTLIDAQSCKTPDGASGRCISIYECKPLLDAVKRKDRTARETEFLKNSQCGLKNYIPMVCCSEEQPAFVEPNNCVTPDGKPGKCINLYQCSHFIHMLLEPSGVDNMDYMKKSVCNGSVAQSVCCGPPREINQDMMTPNEICTRALTAFPPESDSKCCGLQDSAKSKIVGGKEASIDDYPWLVVIEYIKKGQTKLLCGGSLISAKYVLTAKHCVAGRILLSATPKYVRLGEYNTAFDGPDCVRSAGGGFDCTHPVAIFPIEKTIPYPEAGHDIALIRLKIAAFYTDFIRPICLPTMDYTKNPPANLRFLVAGWGLYQQYENGTSLYSEVKRHVEVPYVDKNTIYGGLEKLYSDDGSFVFVDSILSAGGEAGKDSCKGDSGGPLMHAVEDTFIIVGVVSSGPFKCGTKNASAIYMNVYKYVPWIRSTIEA